LNLKLEDLQRFNPDTYVRLIRYLNQHYTIVPFRDIPKANVPYVILRHDVDVSLSAALKMAQTEKNMGLKSTYFILVSSKHYNVLQGENANMIRQISKLGHEIGLHYDAKQYGSYSDNATESLKMEAHILEQILAEGIKSISCHAPTGPSSFMRVNGYIDADDPQLRDMYVHDSGRLWTVKSLSVLLKGHSRRVHLLIHPSLWEGRVARRTRLDDFLQDVLLFLYRIRTLMIRVIHSRESCEN
jgi:hypothetical protein